MDFFNNNSDNSELLEKIDELEEKVTRKKKKRKRRRKKGWSKKKLKKYDKKIRRLEKEIKELKDDARSSRKSSADNDLEKIIWKESINAAPKVLDAFLQHLDRKDTTKDRK